MEVSAGPNLGVLSLGDRDFVDVVLTCIDENGSQVRVPGHRVILSRLSGYLANALRWPAHATVKEYRLNLHPALAEHLVVVVRYLYGASCALSQANACQLLVIADYLQIPHLYQSALAYIAIAVRRDASALTHMVEVASKLGVELALDLCLNSALTTCWEPFVAFVRENESAGSPSLPLAEAVALVQYQCLTVARGLAAELGEAEQSRFDGRMPLGAASAAVVASAVTSHFSAAPSGPTARALSAASGHASAASAAIAAATGDAEDASRRWLRGHLSGLLHTSAAFPRRVRSRACAFPTNGNPSSPSRVGRSDSGERAAQADDTVWLASAGAESDRLARWEARQSNRGRNVAEPSSDSDDDAPSDGDAHPHAWRRPAGRVAGLSPSELYRLRSEVSDVLADTFTRHVVNEPRVSSQRGELGHHSAADRLRRFLCEAEDVLELASAAPVLRGSVLWHMLSHALSVLSPADGMPLGREDTALLRSLCTATAMAFSSPAVRESIVGTIEPPPYVTTGQRNDDETESAGALVPSSASDVRSVPLPRHERSGSLGSDSELRDDGRALDVAQDRGEDAEREPTAWADGKDPSHGRKPVLAAPMSLKPAAWPRLGLQLASLVLACDELRVRDEDELVGTLLDAVIDAWLGTRAAAVAVAQARGEEPDASERVLVCGLRRLCSALWQCIRWEYVTPAAAAAAVTAVQLLCAQGSSAPVSMPPWSIDIGIDAQALHWAYTRHQLGMVVTTPAAAIAAGLRPPRISYAGKPRSARLLGGGGEDELRTLQIVPVPARGDLAAPTLQIPLDAALASGPRATAREPLSAAEAESTRIAASAAPARPLRVVFGDHAVQLLLTAPVIPLLMDGAAVSPGNGAVIASNASPSLASPATWDAAGTGFGTVDGTLAGAAESAHLAGASQATVTRLMRVHQRRSRRRQRAASLAGAGDDAQDEGTAPFDEEPSSSMGNNLLSLTLPRNTAAVEATPLLLPLVALPLHDAPLDLGAAAREHMPRDGPSAAQPVARPASQASSQPAAAAAPLQLTDEPSSQNAAATQPGDAPAADPVTAPAGGVPAVAIDWPPSPATYRAVFGPDAPPDPALIRLRDRAAMVCEAYGDIFRHISVRRGWRTLPFTPEHVALAFTAASQVVALVRHMVDTVWSPGFRIRQVDGQAQAALWELAAPPKDATGLQQWREDLFRKLVLATLQDGTGRLSDGLQNDTVQAALNAHPGN